MQYKTKTFDINPVGTDYFVGDLHGCHDLFMQKLAEVDFNFETDRVFCVGDLIDRGPDSVKCIKLLNKPWFYCVFGNHEDFMFGRYQTGVWEYNGGEWIHNIDLEAFKVLRELVKEKCFNTITVDTEFGRIGVVHAESENNWTDNCQTTQEKNLWGRDKIKAGNRDVVFGIEAVVVGHTPIKDVIVLGNTIYIDTGAVYTKKLTVLPAKEVFVYLGNKKAVKT